MFSDCICQIWSFHLAGHPPVPPDEECVRQGVAFVPASLRQKKPRDVGEGERGRDSKRGNGFWEPNSSEGESDDSGDSMSDLYPRKCLAALHYSYFS